MEKMIAQRYMIVKHIGQGGMADVYVALDTLLNREVAVKVLRGELCSDPIALLRFQREAQASCALIHPNIVEIYDVGEDHGHHYIVMEYIRGKTLKQLIHQRGALLKEEALDVMKQLVSATCEAHKKGIIHRDIKPQNVLVKDDGTIKMVDFGIALAHDALQLTQSDSVMGSVHYLAPELARGENATYQSDIYSLGIVFYELLSGEVPFRAESPVQIALRHMRDEIPSIKEQIPSLPQSVENIILKATVKRKEYRYRTAQEMLNDLYTCMDPRRINEPRLVFEVQENTTTRQTRMLDQVKTAEKKPIRKAAEIKKEATISHQKKKEKKPVYAYFLWAALAFLGVFGLVWVLILGNPLPGTNRMVTVPACEGYTVSECTQLLADTGITINTASITYQFTDDVEEGRIISTTPAEGTEVEKGTQLRLTVSSGMWLVMDDYTGMKINEAKSLIANRYSNVRVITSEEENSGSTPGIVLRQELLLPQDKFSPKSAAEVRLVIAAYPNFMIPQSLQNKNIDEAKSILESMGAQVLLQGEEMPENNGAVNVALSGVVTRSSPSMGTWYTQEEDNYITLYYYY